MIPRMTVYDTREEWLQARGTRITASRGPIVYGVRGSAFALNLELRGRREPDCIDGDGIDIGTAIEPGLLTLLAQRWPRLTIHDPGHALVVDAERAWMAASPDALALHPDLPGVGVVELKTTSAHRKADWFDADGKFAVPPYPHVQTQHQMRVCGAEWGVVAVCIGMGFSASFKWQVVRPDGEWMKDSYLPKLDAFQAALQSDADWPPDNRTETIEALAKLYPAHTPGKTIALPAEAVELLDRATEAKREIKDWEAVRHEAESRIKAMMGDAEIGAIDNERYIQWRVEPRAGHSVSPSNPRVFRARRR